MKPHIPATLIAVDTTPKAHLAARAIDQSLKEADFDDVVFLSSRSMARYSNAIEIPEIKGLEGYSKFCIRDMARYVTSRFALVVQADGYVLNGLAWTNDFLNFDYIGAPFNPSGIVGNGGFSLRSKRLLDFMASRDWNDCHPEDSAISVRHRNEIESAGMKIAPVELARRFAIEGRSWDSVEWHGTANAYINQFGFHSLLTPLPIGKKPCKIFHHSGDAGDVVYSMAAVKELGGGMMFLSTDNKYPHPMPSRWARTGGDPAWVNNLAPLIEHQPYMFGCRFTHGTPFSTDYDLNRFRIPWKTRTVRDFDSILKLHMDAFSLPMPAGPWLSVEEPIVVEGRSIIVNRTQRYHNYWFPWDKFLQKWHEQILFVGSADEAQLFKGLAPNRKIQHYITNNALELARVIAGGARFVGNQSLALAIAHGLCKPVCVEEWPGNPNCRIKRPGAVYGMPKGWL